MKKNYFFTKNKFTKGFTLLEMLIVISIIGILMSVLLYFLNPLYFMRKARDANRKENLSSISLALQTYYSDNNVYPTALPTSEAPFVNNGITYLKKTPTDPTTNVNYFYTTDDNTNPLNFCICAIYENKIPQADKNLCSSTITWSPNVNTSLYDHCVENPF